MVESIEAGASLLLIDEDTSATNFMIRDELMQRVIHRDMEPITPFIDRIRELYENYGISTVIVAGSSGSYFHIADTIIQMDRYVPKDITAYAKKEAENFPMIRHYGLREKRGGKLSHDQCAGGAGGEAGSGTLPAAGQGIQRQ